MNAKKIIKCERSKIEKWSQFQLNNHWKIKGIIFCFIIFVATIVLKFNEVNTEWVRFGFRKALLVGLLVIALSKEKTEDEMIVSLRAKSFRLAFILAVLYALIQPIVDVLVFNLLGKPISSSSFSYFQVLSFMLIIQIMFFEVLKRNR
ncbi:hypothetical protein [Winogradskyella algicola]|uniref:hypothetical protein n=1 Tax=Winogradskyella algicola TaxID=2575815 RepID=UPI00110853C2|nr:hypothetical protein [Winogradskyella algicola]